MEDSGGALNRSNDLGAHPGVPGESLVHAGSHGNGRHDLMAEVVLAAQAPLVGDGPLGNPESPSGRVRSCGRGGDSPPSRAGAMVEVDVANQPHEGGRPGRGGHKCLVANNCPLDRGRRRDVVQPDD